MTPSGRPRRPNFSRKRKIEVDNTDVSRETADAVEVESIEDTHGSESENDEHESQADDMEIMDQDDMEDEDIEPDDEDDYEQSYAENIKKIYLLRKRRVK